MRFRLRESNSGQDDLMFSPKTKSMFFALPLCLAAIVAADVNAQNTASAQYQARMAAMQQAQARGQAVQQTVVEAAPIRVAQGSGTRVPPTMIPGQTIVTPARTCLLYTSPSPRDKRQSRMPSSA